MAFGSGIHHKAGVPQRSRHQSRLLPPVGQRAEAGAPKGAVSLYAVVERPDSCEITGEHHGLLRRIPDDQAPVTKDVDQTFHSPSAVGGERKRCIACDTCLTTQSITQTKQQILAVVDTSI